MCSVCSTFEERVAAGTFEGPGAVAQLVERVHGMDEVARSIRVSSTQFLPAVLGAYRATSFILGGLIAGEGSFIVTTKQPPFADGTPRLRFVFQVSIASRDEALLKALRQCLGYGSIHTRPPERPGWQQMSIFTIASRKAHHAATLPFCEVFLLPSAKRRQFTLWRDALRFYEVERPTRYGKGPSECSVPGCDKPVRGRMLCRSHYYRVTGY